MRKFVAVTLLAGVAMPFAPAAWAQDSAEEAVSSGEIIVTARRREESLSKVPIAITAISGEDIQKRQITNENDLQSAVPGLIVRQNGGANSFNFSIRGQSVDTYTNSPPSVLPYINEVQIVSHSASTFYDMSGIQVLKGPQGTLFGRNTTGGAILFSTAKPTEGFGGYIQGRGGSYGSHHVEVALNLPAYSGVQARIAASYKAGGGYARDFYTGEKYGDNQQTSVRGTLVLEPFAGFTNTTVGQYTDEHGTNVPFQLWSSNPLGGPANEGNILPDLILNPVTNPGFAAFNAARPARFQGGLQAAIALQKSLGPWVSLSDVYPYHKAEQTWVTNTSELDLSADIKLKNIFGYNLAKSDDGQDYDGSPYPYFQVPGTLSADGVKINPTAGFVLRTKQISDELQIQGKALDGRLDYVLGAYYLHQTDSVQSNLSFFSFGLFGDSYPPASFAYTAQWKAESIAGFAQASFKVTDQLSLTGGFRYTRDKTTMVQLPGSVWLFTFPANTPEVTKASKPSWTVSLDYQATPELMFYVSHRGSWRAGGFNYSVAPVPTTATTGGNLFLPETTKDIELGVKYSGDSLGIPVTFNADVFHQWVNNIQRAAYVSGANGVTLLTANVPEAQITGVEADMTVRPSANFQFGASGNYTNARYTKNRLSITLPPDPTNNLAYGPFADAPKFSGTFFAEASADVGEMGRLTLRGDVYAQTKMYFTNVGDTLNSLAVIPGYTLVNARLTLSEIMGTRFSASVSARNLFNKRYYAGGNAANSATLPNTVNPGVPRMIMGELRFAF
jgi:iron complex outermembrane recepter protein